MADVANTSSANTSSANTSSVSTKDHQPSSSETNQPGSGVRSSVVLLIVGYFTVAAVAIGSLMALTAT